MIKPILKNIDIVHEVNDIEDFVTGAQANITTEDSKGADCFYFRILTPKRLAKLLIDEKILLGKAVFIVNEPDMKSNIKLVQAEINKFLPSCARETWEESALAINCYLEWEYYNPACGICDFYKDTVKKLQNGTYSKNTMTFEELLLKHGIINENY